jgi:predicted DCC family thiol-disulfide oxidoreductase YuxK
MPASESDLGLRKPAQQSPPHQIIGAHVLLYDGVCGLCQHTVRWMLRHDPEGRLLFAPQQQPLAAEVFARHGLDMQQVNSAVLVSNFDKPTESLAIRSDAILGCLTILGGFWGVIARIARLIPLFLRDAAYRQLARYRLRLFGTVELCALPTPAERARFLGV